MSAQEIAIRSVQHFLYCPHRWGLLEIDRAWAENVFVTKANLMHERVHDSEKKYCSRGKKVFTAVPVYNDKPEYNLYGVTDCIEATPDSGGTKLDGLNGKYKLCIVEYKPTKPKGRDCNEDDLLQVFAQKICVDYVFHCNCDAAIYYSDVKTRVLLPLADNFSHYDKKLQSILTEMRENTALGIIPPIEKSQQCNGCSMKDICMPSFKKSDGIRSDILASLEEER